MITIFSFLRKLCYIVINQEEKTNHFTGIEIMTKILMQRFGSNMASNYCITLNFMANLRKLVKKLVKLVRKKLITKIKKLDNKKIWGPCQFFFLILFFICFAILIFFFAALSKSARPPKARGPKPWLTRLTGKTGLDSTPELKKAWKTKRPKNFL